MFIQKYISFLICILLYFTSLENAFCCGRDGDYLSPPTSVFRGNKHFITQENYTINQSYDNNDSSDVSIFNVRTFGAKGDGHTNDAQAFAQAWDATCKVKVGVMLIPSGFTFLLQPLTFQGYYCQPNIVVQVDGNIIAPPKKSDWDKLDFQWILFVGLHNGITIRGKGKIDGFGNSWWDHKDSYDSNGARPHAIRIADSINVILIGLTIQNSPYFHFYIDGCQFVQIINFSASSPADSPNTDGIHLSHAQHVLIYNATLACGDDCVSILNGCSDVKIQNVNCGPGHGYSIGGLGAPGLGEADVKDIVVINSKVQNSLTGVRIKTWPGGSGSVKNVTFTNIIMSEVKTAISIDQNYCGGHKKCHTESTQNAVAISNITYEGITGTFKDISVSLVCSKYKVCRNLQFANINLTPSHDGAAQDGSGGTVCLNAYGKVLTKTTPPLDRCVLEFPAPMRMPGSVQVQNYSSAKFDVA